MIISTINLGLRQSVSEYFLATNLKLKCDVPSEKDSSRWHFLKYVNIYRKVVLLVGNGWRFNPFGVAAESLMEDHFIHKYIQIVPKRARGGCTPPLPPCEWGRGWERRGVSRARE